jgi:acetylornithine deacetylase/succinyl-diaminopimelate desuccinylase-like protein
MISKKTNTVISQQPVELLQRLIQFDTTNPPGIESECIKYIQGLLDEAGIETKIFAKGPERPNLIARLSGRGNASPLLLYGHVDVVTTQNQKWQHPPFQGKLVDGFVWGRGALDMKGGVAMMLAAFLRAKAENRDLPGDVVLTIVSDEEAGGDFGAKFLVEKHAEQFEGVRYAIGEFGGFSMSIAKKRFYPIQVAEKQICWLKATVRGPGGHGSLPVQNGAMAKLGRLLQILDNHRLPVHITQAARLMFSQVTSKLDGINKVILGQLLNPRLTNRVIDMMGERGRLFDPLFHHTVSPSILYGSQKINVIPGEVSVELDGRLLPGYQPDDMIYELHQVLGDEVELEIVQYDPGPAEPNMEFFDSLAGILQAADHEAAIIPLLLSGVTDGRFFSRLGIQTYGFLPMQLPEDFNFTQTIHAADERIPAEAVEFGANAIYAALKLQRT